jgi:hypothetical protein
MKQFSFLFLSSLIFLTLCPKAYSSWGSWEVEGGEIDDSLPITVLPRSSPGVVSSIGAFISPREPLPGSTSLFMSAAPAIFPIPIEARQDAPSSGLPASASVLVDGDSKDVSEVEGEGDQSSKNASKKRSVWQKLNQLEKLKILALLLMQDQKNKEIATNLQVSGKEPAAIIRKYVSARGNKSRIECIQKKWKKRTDKEREEEIKKFAYQWKIDINLKGTKKATWWQELNRDPAAKKRVIALLQLIGKDDQVPDTLEEPVQVRSFIKQHGKSINEIRDDLKEQSNSEKVKEELKQLKQELLTRSRAKLAEAVDLFLNENGQQNQGKSNNNTNVPASKKRERKRNRHYDDYDSEPLIKKQKVVVGDDAVGTAPLAPHDTQQPGS